MVSTTSTTTQTIQSSKPTKIPDVQTLRDAIPAKCFQRSLLRSSSYVARDLAVVSALFFSAVELTKLDLPPILAIPAWGLYSFVTGLFFTGLWILAHECGHDAFSSHTTVNATVGWVLHSMLLVPFFSWKFSHSRHHRYANHIEKDTVFVPHRKPKVQIAGEAEPSSILSKILHRDHTAADSPIVSFITLVAHQLLGWQVYILINASAGVGSLTKGSRKESPRYKQSHLDPTAHIFTSSEQPFILLSDIGLVITLCVLYQVSKSFGVVNTCLIYGLPYLWMNHWIIAITYLHHTHPDAAHYEAENWTYAKGALSTIDREFGFIGRHIFHGIIEYHVVHHIFPRIPFYHAEEATHAIAPLLGRNYIEQRTNFLADLWLTFSKLNYVEDDKNGRLVWAIN
ncbi:fatty acid desaturase [Paraphoma chrysanthemicola]|uniref:Fatty acid desaturase n=1 Tax=Paraphoma chrysanthemicola TaxID=798071 RepID=A0A8K0W0A1_9PLEO|nr:fatty acid desaturase [Paraphoma chrysanthemicola]